MEHKAATMLHRWRSRQFALIKTAAAAPLPLACDISCPAYPFAPLEPCCHSAMLHSQKME
ncbi:hypothetical protein ATPR_1317 [Acetobacter tropicalis NBRC 101654]|uniref:Uncharacterized protein n=1 Tax=Acetobacter tropicalis NBRC 101654 TaxID=749388 RepID=F7VD68_9PROT|nr:hypothetical protein ATPR_1317 [Acetobacter tropicalis NBRC 101654]